MADADSILAHLRAVDAERRRRAASPELAVRVLALKAYQQRRFLHTYRDLLESARYGSAARFFLDELYGPRDFSHRDAQFARVVPALVRLFPHDIVSTVDTLAHLHALSESLDSLTAGHLAAPQVDASAYVHAWQAAGRPDDRERQVRLTLAVGESLDRVTRNPLLRHSLRMMRGPAKAAGLAELQRFLEAGFDTFKTMHGSADFLAIIGTRERDLARLLFEARPHDAAAFPRALGQLP
jgi:hypothetical protein